MDFMWVYLPVPKLFEVIPKFFDDYEEVKPKPDNNQECKDMQQSVPRRAGCVKVIE
jgi:hypothetical protein